MTHLARVDLLHSLAQLTLQEHSPVVLLHSVAQPTLQEHSPVDLLHSPA